MSQDTDKIIKQLPVFEPPAGLFDKVLLRLERERKLAVAKRRLIVFSGCLVISISASLPIWRLVFSELAQSGLGQYLTLLVYDFQTVAAYWQDYSLSLLEALPAASLAVGLGLLLLALASLRAVVHNIRTFTQLSRHKFINH
jgi:hypothetical protein